MIRNSPLLPILLAIAATSSLQARDWFVNPFNGNDRNEGAAGSPLATAQEAVDRAETGDRISLLPPEAVYRQSIDFRSAKDGLIVEGNGVILTGADPIGNAPWEDLGGGLFRTKLPANDGNRALLIVNGRAERMRRFTQGEVAFPPSENLKPGQFRWDAIDEKTGWLTVRGPTSGLEWSTRQNGIATSGRLRNLKVYHLIARHFLNDGFNIHGDSRGLQFFAVEGHENFDEGFSAHDTSECWIYDSFFSRNENAVADVNAAETYYSNCRMGESLKVDVLFQGGRHRLFKCRITPGPSSIPLTIREGGSGGESRKVEAANLVMQEVQFDPSPTSNPRFDVGPGTRIYYDSSTAESLAALTVSVHETSEMIESLHRSHAIGRNSSGTPIMAWSGGVTSSLPSQAYRIIHFGKHSPEEFSATLLPDNDWMGLLSPLDTTEFPPTGPAFSPENSSAHAIWRWIGLTAPDAVFVPDTPEGLALGAALQETPPAGVGMVHVFINRSSADGIQESVVLPNTNTTIPLAKDEMQERIKRTPEELILQLGAHYGNSFEGSYIEALALIAKQEAGVTNRAVELAEAWLKKTTNLPKSGGEIAGALLYRGIDQPWAKEHLLRIANIAFDSQGNPLEAMPTHNEMSDAIFMSCPLLAQAGEISGDPRYFDQCLRNYVFIAGHCLRSDGLYRHSPLNEAAWGRGNGFPVLGLSLALQSLPEDHNGYPVLLEAFRSLLSSLAKHQDGNGMWHQVIDYSDTYAELTATCMIAYGIASGLNHGWLKEAEWSSRLESAWNGVKSHISTDGNNLINVCTGTGKQKTLEDYYLREAILGNDARGGSMALLLAQEMKKRYTQ